MAEIRIERTGRRVGRLLWLLIALVIVAVLAFFFLYPGDPPPAPAPAPPTTGALETGEQIARGHAGGSDRHRGGRDVEHG